MVGSPTNRPESAFGICTAYYSDDEGDSWNESRDPLYVYDPKNHLTAPVEIPTIMETGDGRILMFMRNHVGRIAYSYSSDRGEHWTTPKLNDLVSCNAEIYLAHIPSTGDLVCIWNQASPEEVHTGYYRGRLTAAISKDMGETWQHFRTVASTPGMKEVSKLEPSPVKYNKSRFAVPPKEHIASEGFFMNVFPRVNFIGDTAYLIYNHREYSYPEESNKFVREYNRRRLRVFDARWFYDEQ